MSKIKPWRSKLSSASFNGSYNNSSDADWLQWIFSPPSSSSIENCIVYNDGHNTIPCLAMDASWLWWKFRRSLRLSAFLHSKQLFYKAHTHQSSTWDSFHNATWSAKRRSRCCCRSLWLPCPPPGEQKECQTSEVALINIKRMPMDSVQKTKRERRRQLFWYVMMPMIMRKTPSRSGGIGSRSSPENDGRIE